MKDKFIINDRIFNNPIDEYEIVNIINNLCTNTALGPHSVPTDILNQIKLNIADPLAEIVNLSCENGIYIDNLKISKTVPTLKDKESRLNYNNYRQITLLSNINKLIE